MLIAKVARRARSLATPRHWLFYAQRSVKSPKLRAAIARRLPAKAVERHAPASARVEADLAVVERDGFLPMGSLLSPGQISDIKEYFDDKLLVDRFHPWVGRFKISTPPKGTHVANYLTHDVLRAPHVLELANNPLIVAIAEAFLGCKPTISSIAVWWSLVSKEQAADAELFHRDYDDWRFIKLFVYLTEVGPEDGPHVFVRGSQLRPELLPIRRYADAEIEACFGADAIVKFTGQPGMGFLENTFGFHKGQAPTLQPRLALQVQYSVLPIYGDPYTPLEMSSRHDPYMNRLFVRPAQLA